jgi:nitrous oxidase accessory protein
VVRLIILGALAVLTGMLDSGSAVAAVGPRSGTLAVVPPGATRADGPTRAPPAVARVVRPGELAAAVAHARPGDTLRLAAGVHAGPLTVTMPLKLVGDPGAVIDGGGRGTALTLAANGIVVSGLTIRGSGADLAHDEAAVLLREVEDVTVEDCHVDARAFGIYLQAGGRHRIVRNEIRGDASLPIARRGNGIHLWYSEANEIADNRVADVRDGIYLSFAHRNVIHGNRGTALRYGIHYMYSERNVLERNRFAGCTGGIALMFSLENHIAGNVATDNRDFGILCLQLERSTLTANRVARNGRGLFVENSARNRFTANRLEGNGVGAFLTAGSEGNVFTANRFDGNLVQVFEDHGGENVWSEQGRGNAWSDYAGFDWNGDGVGELPYRLQTPASALLARRPLARWFLLSPVLALLDWWETQMLRVDPASFDPAPLVHAAGRR